MQLHHKRTCHGTTTVGEKGQVVIPSEARAALKLKKGEKLLVFGMDKDVLVFTKLSNLEKIASHLSENLKGINDILKKAK